MDHIKYALGVDISTQTVTVMLAGVVERDSRPSELIVSGAWVASRPCRSNIERRTPGVWAELVCECIEELKLQARETYLVRAVGISTTFPGIFAIMRDGTMNPQFASLYDNTDSAGMCDPEFEELLARAESDTLNRIWPGNMAVGLAHLVKTQRLDINDVAALVPPNTAFAYALLKKAGFVPAPSDLFSDLTQTAISGMYDSRTGTSLPAGVVELLRSTLPEINPAAVRELLPAVRPSWTNAIPVAALSGVRDLLGLPELAAISIGAGDSPLGSLALYVDRDTVINVRGSSDSPMIVADAPRERSASRETVLHYPMPSARSMKDSPWCVVAPMLRSGRVWDWVRALRFDDRNSASDRALELMAVDALKARLRAPAGSPQARPLQFNTALGGERAPNWDSNATGHIYGLLENHGLGDIALAALEGMSISLNECVRLMENRYDVATSKMLLAGGPTRNRLWNWITQVFNGKKTYATTFSDASLLGAALLGHGALRSTQQEDGIGEYLIELSMLASHHPLIDPVPVGPPDSELAALEERYKEQAQMMKCVPLHIE